AQIILGRHYPISQCLSRSTAYVAKVQIAICHAGEYAMSDVSKTGSAPAEGSVDEPPPITFAEFLESVPPSQYQRVANVRAKRYRTGGTTSYHHLATPEIQLHCPSDTCNGLRFFRYMGDDIVMKEKSPENKQLFII